MAEQFENGANDTSHPLEEDGLPLRCVWPELPGHEEWTPFLDAHKDGNWHSNFGPICREFETTLFQEYGQPGEVVVSASSATAGLTACLVARRLRGKVLCPAFTFQASACAILAAGCEPVIVDVEADTGLVSPERLADALRVTQARAALLVAPYGIRCNFSEHAEVCAAAGAYLIIDNAAGLGIDRASAKTPVVAEHVAEVFSLHATKPFGIGEGGAVFAAARMETALRSAMNFGLASHTADGTSAKPFWGINGKLSEVGAAIGLAVARTMPQRVRARQTMAREWIDTFAELPDIVFCRDPSLSPWQVFPIILSSERMVTEFQSQMLARGVDLRRYYFPSLGACRGMESVSDCPNAQALSQRAIVLPVRSFMTQERRHDLYSATLTSLKATHATGSKRCHVV
ncbi:DegT/DnrJ/EryC1/StrS family aminotransferase [Halovulum sp. GXIMD14794]